MLRLSRSGRLLGGGVEDPVPPKTYTTRKGHLILYSEDLVSSSSQSAANRKGLGSKQEADQPLHTLRDLTGAILAYRRKQVNVTQVLKRVLLLLLYIEFWKFLWSRLRLWLLKRLFIPNSLTTSSSMCTLLLSLMSLGQ